MIYFAQHPSNAGEFIAITHGETGYSPTTIYTQDHADALNDRAGTTPAQVEAAIICSMFDTWRKFDSIVQRLEDKQS